MENASANKKKEKPDLYVPKWYREMAKDLMESFEGTSTSPNFSAKHWDKIERMLY